MKNFKKNILVFIFLLIPHLSFAAADQKEEAPNSKKVQRTINAQQYWRLDLDYLYQHFSFSSAGQSATFLVSYCQDKKFYLRSGLNLTDKFNTTALGGTLGASYWFAPKLAVAVDGFWATKQNILP